VLAWIIPISGCAENLQAVILYQVECHEADCPNAIISGL
jgi:hypothetical protein